jgi:hypothetical protein
MRRYLAFFGFVTVVFLSAQDARCIESRPLNDSHTGRRVADVRKVPVGAAAVTYVEKTASKEHRSEIVDATCSLTVARDYVYDFQCWKNVEIDPGSWDLLNKTWLVDYNCLLRVLMRPNAAGDYDVQVEVDPYMVRLAYGDTVLTEDGVTEYARLGYTPDFNPILVRIDLLVSDPCGYWDPPASLMMGEKRTVVLAGGACYGDWSVVVDLWNSATDDWVSKTVNFIFEDPCVRNDTEGGYLVDVGLITTRSESIMENPANAEVPHPAGTVRYYASELTPRANDTVDIMQVFEPARTSDSTYGSQYEYAPIHLVSMTLEGYGERGCWPADCGGLYSPPEEQRCQISVPASSIANPGCTTLELRSDFTVIPRTYKASGSTAFGWAFTPDADTLLMPDTVTAVVGSVAGSPDDFAIPSEPLTADVVTSEICVQPQTYVYISQFDATERGGAVELSWRIDTDEDLEGYRVYRRRDDQREERLITNTGLLPPAATTFIDDDVTPGHQYHYTLVVVKTDGSVIRSRAVSVEMGQFPFALLQNHPNPFNPSTTIPFGIDRRALVVLSVYDVKGRLVRTLVNRPLTTGTYAEFWDGRDAVGREVASGVYFYRLSVGRKSLVRKSVLLR